MATTARYASWDGEIFGERRSGTTRDYVPDPLGSVYYVLGAAQAVGAQFTYWPYGEVRSSTDNLHIPFRFVGTRGYYNDRGSNGAISRTYVRARYLSMSAGRWLTGSFRYWGDGEIKCECKEGYEPRLYLNLTFHFVDVYQIHKEKSFFYRRPYRQAS